MVLILISPIVRRLEIQQPIWAKSRFWRGGEKTIRGQAGRKPLICAGNITRAGAIGIGTCDCNAAIKRKAGGELTPCRQDVVYAMPQGGPAARKCYPAAINQVEERRTIMTRMLSRGFAVEFSRLRRGLLAGAIAALAAVAVIAAPKLATAEQQEQQAPNQIQLNAKQVESFISSVKDISALIEKIESSAQGNPTPQQMASLDAIAKKHGFKDFSEYEDVADSISVVMSGIDPQTKQFTQPPEFLKKQIAQVQADKSIDAKERKGILQDLNEQLKTAQTVKFPGNITLVLKYYDKLEAAMQ
jgi:hypothetical protein